MATVKASYFAHPSAMRPVRSKPVLTPAPKPIKAKAKPKSIGKSAKQRTGKSRTYTGK